MDPMVIAAAAGAVKSAVHCSAPARAARIHLVDGMPFVVALRSTLRARTQADGARPGAHAFVLYDGTHELATVHFAADGSVVVHGYVAAVSGGAAVDVSSPAAGCPAPAREIVLKPS